MNDEKLRQARTNLYLRMATRLVRALAPFLGTKPDTKAIARTSRPFVVATRQQAQQIAYQDYLRFVRNQDPIPKMEQNRFTDDLWNASVEKQLDGVEVFGADHIEDITMKADYWARDAEWGQRVDVAKKDPRIDKVARVDFKPPTCPFCVLLNSRGAVYLNMDTAARTLHDGDTCSLVWVKKGQTDYPGHESSAEALRRYKEASKSLGRSANTSSVLKALAEQDPDRPMGSVRKNAKAEIENVTAAKIKEAQARIAALEKLNPKSDSAIKYRDEQLTRNRNILKALEGNTQ